MYAGFVVTLLNLLLSLPVLGRYSHDATADKNRAATDTLLNHLVDAARATAAWRVQNQMVGVMAILLIADILGLFCWAWLAIAARRGNGWTRIAGSVLLGIYTICTLLVVFKTRNDPGVEFTTIVVWAVGVATIIPLWSQQARGFFDAWRKG
jgi:hypothetical protein